MNSAKRIADLLGGKKVKGEVAAVLPSEMDFNQRYAVRTEEGILDTHIPYIKRLLGTWHLVEPLKKGEQVDQRANRVRPWIDGSRV